jgi:serine phosphatase RsbU (regulator of sigma subunit)
VSWSAWLICALVAGGVGYLSLAGFVWANREGIGSRPLVLMLLAVKVWSLCYALELSSRSIEVAQWWSVLKYTGIVALPPALWSFVYAYTGRGRLSPRALRLMMIHPVVVMILLFLPLLVPHVPYALLLQEYGDPPDKLLGAPVPGAAPPLFWVHAAYVYGLMLSADFVLLARLTKIARPYRRQGTLLIAASLLPCFGNIGYNAGLFRDGLIDPTPFLFGVTAVVLVWGFFRLRLLDLTPVARGIVIEQMADGVMVLDVYGRIADVNAAAAAIVSHPRRGLVGRYAVEVVPGLGPLLEKADAEPRTGTVEDEVRLQPARVQRSAVRSISEMPGEERPVPVAEGPARDIAASITWVTDQLKRPIARLVVLRDVSERNRTEHRLRELLDEQTRLSETLRQTLRPASLPHLPGLRLAARSVPSAREGGVGGDFYDVHPVGDGVSAFVLGDVSGKGVHAAVVTSMARYTVRTLSAQGWRPREVLQQLNRALQTADDPERFCTVVYGQVHTPASTARRSSAGEPLLAQYPAPEPEMHAPGGIRVVLTLGGHPPPLLRRRDRSVHPVGEAGTVLGLLPTVDVREVTVHLAAGDVLLAYTDGVTEARCGDEQFGEQRLADVLAGVEHLEAEPGLENCSSPDGTGPAAHLADRVADAVLRAVNVFSSERDDVALLVLAAT